MWDFWWDWSYGITKGLLKLIDMIMEVALKLIGINGVKIDGEETDFLTYLFGNSRVQFGFAIASILAIILMVIVTIFAIVRTIGNEKVEDTPLKICKKCFVNIIILMLVPLFMVAFTVLCNAFLRVMYYGLIGSDDPSIANSLFATFAQSSSTHPYSELVSINWRETDVVRAYCNLNEFEFIYSWIISIALLISLGLATLSLVERFISIVVLYIAAPFTVATAVIDDGQRFKAWRDMVLTKFLICYGMLVGIIVYMIVAGVIYSDSVRFFDSDFLNYFTKAFFLLGGAVSLRAVQSIVGNLVQAGAGDKAMQDQGMAAAGFGGALARTGRALSSPFRAGRSLYNFGADTKQYGFWNTVGARTGIKTSWDYKRDYALKQLKDEQEKEKQKKEAEASGNKNNASPSVGNNNAVNDAINGGNGPSTSNQNNAPVSNATKGKNMVNNAISDAASLNNDKNVK